MIQNDAEQVLCQLTDIPDAGAIEANAFGESIVVLRYGDQVNAYLNICPHAGRPLNWAPGRFLLSHGQLVCAAHGAAFKPESGECIGGPCRGQSLKRVHIERRGEAIVGLVDSSSAS